MKALLITLLSGFAFLIGHFLSESMGHGKKIITLSVGLAFSIMIGLIVTDLLPETIELMDNKITMCACIVFGVLILKALDAFVPDHDHTPTRNKDHIAHIGLVTAIALFIHNAVEGTAIYNTALSDAKAGILLALAVSCHNIPLGMQISSLISNKKEKLLIVILLMLSSVIGGLALIAFHYTPSEMVEGVLISTTIGMLIYIIFFELLCEVKENIKKKQMQIGLALGVIVSIICFILG